MSASSFYRGCVPILLAASLAACAGQGAPPVPAAGPATTPDTVDPALRHITIYTADREGQSVLGFNGKVARNDALQRSLNSHL